MGKYIAKRILWLIPVIVGVTFLIFTIMFFIPGDPVAIMLGSSATQAEIEQAREMLGLNGSYLHRFWNYASGVFLRFDLGTSFQYGTSVTADMLTRFPRTFTLAVASMLISICVGVPLGVIAATHQNTFSDRASMIIAMFGVSMPSFWLAILLVLLFSMKLGLLPSYGIGGLKFYILPAIANSFGGIAGFARQTRSSVLECIRADYVTTARAKGVSEKKVLMGHILPNSMIPIITYAGTQFSGLLGGAIVIENVFTIPGIGTYMVQAINYRDYGAVQGSVIFSAITFSVVMLIVDVIYAYVDPRIKAQYENKQRSTKNGKNKE
ncbi:ABC transporter permease [Hungatella hathewayi]|uniref:ABC transporter permease n=1 Tax=Hungatella hathewayi TaxID=154046 RepID=A0A374NZ25_9FIRM|nr:ABC transporter permease [Hungatella hathewayi]RGI97282.1 ABC transporter permease [Hungatella hathewayi]